MLIHPSLESLALLLFVPADRPDRYAKALTAGADAVIIDLQDAVAADQKAAARSALAAARDALAAAPCPVLVRINACGTPAHEADLAPARQFPLAGIMLSKAEAAADVQRVAAATGLRIIALIESARGLAAARSIAAADARLAFGSIDFCADLGCAHTRPALLLARSELVLASRLGGVAGPIDGVSATVADTILVEDDARDAAALGFSGKLLIHPAQIGPARAGFRPTPDEVRWAERILSMPGGSGAIAVDGAMIDAPVRLRAEQIRRRQAAFPAQ